MATILVFGLLVLTLFFAAVRLIRGPDLPNRVVAVDMMSTIAIGFITAYAVFSNQSMFLDVAIVLALISFLGTVAFAIFIEKGYVPWQRS